MNGLAEVMPYRYKLAGYIRREALGVCLMTLAVLMAISVVLFLAELLGDLADGELLLSTLLELLLLRMPEALLLTAPLALVIGLLMSLGELAQGEEFSVMRSAGLKPRKLLRVILGLALAWAGGLVLVSGWLAPWAEQRSMRIAERMADDLLLASIRPGQFQTLGGGKLTVYVRTADLDAGRLRGLFVHFVGDGQVEVIAAESGRITRRPDSGARVLSLRDGVHIGHQDQGGGLPMRRIEFERNDIQLPIMADDDPDNPERRRYLPALLEDGSASARLELQRRLMPAIIGLVLALFALPITLTGARGNRFGVVLIAVVIYLVYSNTTSMVLVRMASGTGTGAWPGTWPLHALALALAMIPLAAWWRRW
ncbi:MAG: LPS export ABC transporter permease LptF [Wenzhouxiangellaceae bacterium]